MIIRILANIVIVSLPIALLAVVLQNQDTVIRWLAP